MKTFGSIVLFVVMWMFAAFLIETYTFNWIFSLFLSGTIALPFIVDFCISKKRMK